MIESVETYRRIIREVMPLIQGVIDQIQTDCYCRDNKPMTVDQALEQAVTTEDHAIKTLVDARAKLEALVDPVVVEIDRRGAYVEIVSGDTVCVPWD